MIRRWGGTWLMIFGCIWTIVALSLGAWMPRWIMIFWVALAGIGWTLLAVAFWLLRQITGEDP